MNCSSDHKIFANLGLQPFISKMFSITRKKILTEGQNNFENIIPFLTNRSNGFYPFEKEVKRKVIRTSTGGD